jgi:hypothetical protein
MTSQLEFISRAALCRQLARQEPAHRALWMAEAENWLRLSKERPCDEATEKIGLDLPASLRPRSARYLSVRASSIVRSLLTPCIGL